MLKILRGLSSDVVSENPYWQYKQDRYCLPNGREAMYYYASTFGSVFIIARVDDGRFVMTQQFRYLNQRVSLEFPGGGLKANTEALQQAQAELLEESGYTAGRWTYLGDFNPMNGLSNEICHVYLAENLTPGSAQPEESEEIEVLLMSDAELRNAIHTNTLWDGMTLAAWSLYIHSAAYDVREKYA